MYRAILLDVDGTLLDDGGRIRPRTRSVLHDLHGRGVRVMVSTGRSEGGTRPVVAELGIQHPAVVYNGAAVWCPETDKLLEERVLSNHAVARSLAFAEAAGLMVVVMRNGEKVAVEPRDEVERSAIDRMEDMRYVASAADLPREYLTRVTILSAKHTDSALLFDEVDAAIAAPTYLTHFPLSALVEHRASPMQVVDVQPPCRGKGEAVRWLGEVHGIDPAAVIAIGDANNDLPMFEAAGLALAMANGMACAKEAADRVIGDNNTDAIADVLSELFGLAPVG